MIHKITTIYVPPTSKDITNAVRRFFDTEWVNRLNRVNETFIPPCITNYSPPYYVRKYNTK